MYGSRDPVADVIKKFKEIDERFERSTAARPVMDGPFTIFVANLGK
jgi:hypothetical protein